MSQDEEQRRRTRIEIETPTSHREVVQSQVTTRYPAERKGMSTGTVAAIALTAIAATAIIFLFLMNRSDDAANTNVNIRTAAATTPPTPLPTAPVIVQQQPLTQPTPIIIQQPAPIQPAPVIIQQQPATAAAPADIQPTAAAPANVPDDAGLQTKVDKAFSDDPDIVNATVNTMVVNGKVMLTGTVKSDDLKRRAERLAYAVKGIRSVDNKIAVDPNAP